MKDSAYAFAVSAVRVRENGLLSRNQLESLVTAADDSAALRLLEDFGYKGITSDAEKLDNLTASWNSAGTVGVCKLGIE